MTDKLDPQYYDRLAHRLQAEGTEAARKVLLRQAEIDEQVARSRKGSAPEADPYKRGCVSPLGGKIF